MTFKKIILLVGLTTLLVACGTKVPLTEPAKVEDRSSQTVGAGIPSNTNVNTNPNQGNITTRDVKPVEASPVNNSLSNIVYFDFDSYSVKPEGQRALEAQAKVLSANRSAKVSLAGHTDDLGGREYNLALGQKRADAVKRALSILGVTESQMESVSYGKEKPANPSTDEAARTANRRVEISAR